MSPVRVRRLRSDDEPALTALVDRAREAGDLLASSAPHGEWILKFALEEPDQVAVAVAGDEGGIAGVVLPEVKALVVEPALRRQGIGRALVEAGAEIERERGRPELLLGVLPGDERGLAFLRATGFAHHSTLWDLDLAPEVDVAAPWWPEGLTARLMAPERDIGPLADLFNAAFADHATPLQVDASSLGAWIAEGAFPAGDLLVVEDGGGAMVGFCSPDPKRRPGGGVEPRGEIWTIGVRPDMQGRGLGRQLLRWGVGHLRGLGVETVTLSVNGRNPRALGLYEAEGFVRTSTRERWARRVAVLAPKT